MPIRQLALVLCWLALPLPALAQSQGGKTMQKYVIERNLPGAGKLSPAELQAISQKSNEVLRGMGPKIQWVQSYVTDDKIYCVYLAVSEQLIREHAQRAGFPAEAISAVRAMIDPTMRQPKAAATAVAA